MAQSSEAEEEAITNRLLQKLRSAQVKHRPALNDFPERDIPALNQEECESAKAQRRHGNPASSDSDRDTLAVELKVRTLPQLRQPRLMPPQHAVAKYEALRAQQVRFCHRARERVAVMRDAASRATYCPSLRRKKRR